VASEAQQLPLEIPDKVFFRIGEVSRLTGVKAYVLRYWETEFAGLRPKKSNKGQRLYRKADVEAVLKIKSLLWEQGFTIKGARAHLRGGADAEVPVAPAAAAPAAAAPAAAAPAAAAPTAAADPQVQLALDAREQDLATVRSALAKMRSHVAAFLDDLSH
jgi:DNA-binding transcriptional MerR regulator